MTAQLIVDIVTNATGAVLDSRRLTKRQPLQPPRPRAWAARSLGIAKVIATGYAVEKVVDFGKESVNAAQTALVANQRLAPDVCQGW